MSERGRHARSTGVDEDPTTAQPQGDAHANEAAWPFDPELVRLVRFINAVDGAEVGLTLHVKGCVVSGMLISVAQYYRMLVKEFTELNGLSEQSNRDVAGSLAKFYGPALEKVEKDAREIRAGNAPEELPRHLHFRQAQTVLSGQGPITRSLWRGRLTEVDGWSFGNPGPVAPLGHGLSL